MNKLSYIYAISLFDVCLLYSMNYTAYIYCVYWDILCMYIRKKNCVYLQYDFIFSDFFSENIFEDNCIRKWFFFRRNNFPNKIFSQRLLKYSFQSLRQKSICKSRQTLLNLKKNQKNEFLTKYSLGKFSFRKKIMFSFN